MDKIQYLKSIKGPEQKSDEWHKRRGLFITSSSFATVFGDNKYAKSYTVLIEKCLPIGVNKPFMTNDAVQFGNRHEREAIDLYCKLMNKTSDYEYPLISWEQANPVRQLPDEIKEFLNQNPHLRTDILACSVDGIAIDNDDSEGPVLLEIKCPHRRKILFDGIIYPGYYSQVQWNMWIMDIEKADYVEYNPPENQNGKVLMNIIRVYRDPEYFKKYLVVLNDFWKEVEHWRSIGIENHPMYKKHMGIV
jgi:hypothetical protein